MPAYSPSGLSLARCLSFIRPASFPICIVDVVDLPVPGLARALADVNVWENDRLTRRLAPVGGACRATMLLAHGLNEFPFLVLTGFAGRVR